MTPNTKITITPEHAAYLGCATTGKVTRLNSKVPNSGIVFVQMDGDTRERWMHAASLTIAQ